MPQMAIEPFGQVRACRSPTLSGGIPPYTSSSMGGRPPPASWSRVRVETLASYSPLKALENCQMCGRRQPQVRPRGSQGEKVVGHFEVAFELGYCGYHQKGYSAARSRPVLLVAYPPPM